MWASPWAGWGDATRRTAVQDPVTSPVALDQPAWRGWFHVAAFLVAIPAGTVLIGRATGASAVTAASIYTAGLLLCFGTSAAYHRLARSGRARRIMQRADHAMIFVLIASTYTPICLVALPRAWGIPLLSVVWATALLGIVLKVWALGRFRVVEHALYPVLGWCVVAIGPVLVGHLRTTELALVLAGGLLYTIGVPVLALRWPNPWPRTFGYHEVWHALTIAAAVCHFGAVALLVR
jgi:hemolysin III